MCKYKIILICFLVLFCAACSVNEPTVKTSDENIFWKAFRQAVLDNNQEAIVALTHFPFQVCGVDNCESVKSYEQKDFYPIYERLVTQQVYFPEGRSLSSKSMWQMIEAKSKITQGDFITPTLIQFLQFEFELLDEQWLFTRAYLDE